MKQSCPAALVDVPQLPDTTMNAARHGYWHTFKLAYQHMKLLEKGTLNVRSSDNGESALHLALDPSQQLKMKLRLLLFADTRPVPTAEYVKVLLGDAIADRIKDYIASSDHPALVHLLLWRQLLVLEAEQHL